MILRNLACAFVALALANCKKDEATTPPDDATAATDSAEAAPEPVPQDPDPPELAQLRDRYLRGEYSEVEQQAQPLAQQWSEPTQVRASSFASAWHALAAAESMPDAAKPAVEAALTKAAQISDAEAEQLALIARGVYLMRLAEPGKAQTDLDRAVELAAEPQNTSLATLFRAESLLNQAYGPDDRLSDASKLAEARQGYDALVGGNSEPMLKARAQEGLAAIAKETGDKAALCQLTGEVTAAYEANGAAEFLRQGPQLMATDAGCDAP